LKQMPDNGLPLMIWQSGTDQMAGYFNKLWLDFKNRTIGYVSGNGWIESVHPDDYDNIFDIYQSALKSQKPFQIEYRLRSADGSYYWVLDYGVPKFTTNGLFDGYAGCCVDISGYKKAEESFGEFDEIFQKILNTIPQFICWKDINSEYRGCNKNYADFAGIYDTRSIIGKTDFDLPWMKSQAEQFIMSDRKTMETNNAEYHIIEHVFNGEEREIMLNSNRVPLHDKYGNVNGILVSSEDITNREQMIDDLRQSEEKYRLLHENAGIGIGYYKPDGTVISFNRLAAKNMNGSPEDFIGKSIYDIFPKAEAEFYHNRIKKSVLSEYSDVYEDSISLPSGDKYFLSTFTRIIDFNNNISGVQIISQDITDQKQSEYELRKLSIAVDQSPACIVITGKDGTIEYVNPKFVELTGYTVEEAIGNNPKILQSGKTPDAQYKQMWDTILSGRVWRGNFINKKKNGELYVESAIIAPIVNDHGGIKNFIAVKEDITERTRAEEKVNDLLAEKEFLLKEVHHRIKNNMNTIKGLLTLQIMAAKDSSAIVPLKDAESRVQSMITLYDRLYCTENYRELPVKDYLERLAEEIINSFPNREIVEIKIEIEDFILNVQMLSPLGIIVNEILTNIMKHAFTGRESGLITLTASLQDNHPKIVIADNGVGIPESISFENSKGFGLELAGMLTEQIGGSIRIERGEGTKFVVEFDV